MEQQRQPSKIMAYKFESHNVGEIERIDILFSKTSGTKLKLPEGQTRYEVCIELSNSEQIESAIGLLYATENCLNKELFISERPVLCRMAIRILECYFSKLRTPMRERSDYCTDEFKNLRIMRGESFRDGTHIRRDNIVLPCKHIEDFECGLEWWRYGIHRDDTWIISLGEISRELGNLVTDSHCGWCPGFEPHALETAVNELPKVIKPADEPIWDWLELLDGRKMVTPVFPRMSEKESSMAKTYSGDSYVNSDNDNSLPWTKPDQSEEGTSAQGRTNLPDFSLIGGLESEIQELRKVFEWPLKQPGLFIKLGIKPPKAALLVGPPGGGKTLLARAVAKEISADFIAVGATDLIGSYVGETERNIRELFAEAKGKKPAIIFIDEVDAIVTNRARAERQYEVTPLNQLLVLMDGFDPLEGVGLLFATNRLEVIDPAFYRPGRIDKVITVPLPDENARHQILKIHARKMPIADETLFCDLARETAGFSGAELQGLVQEAGMIAMNRHMAHTEEASESHLDTGDKEILVTSTDFADALAKLRASKAAATTAADT